MSTADISFHFLTLVTVLFYRGQQELQAVSAAIQTVLSTPVSVATALKGIQKTLGKALPFKVWRHCISSTLLSDLCYLSYGLFYLVWLSDQNEASLI